MAAAEQQFHILAVDDNLLDRKLIERLLKISSFQVTTVDSGIKALEFLGFQEDEEGSNTNQPSVSSNSQMKQEQQRKKGLVEVNLIITDYCMPGMTGYHLLKKIKESSSCKIRNIPVVILSSEDVPSRITRCLEEGAEEFFIKPMRLSDVNKLRPHILKAKYDVQNGQENTEQNCNDTDLLKPEKQQEQQQAQQKNKRKSIEEGLSPDRTRHKYSGLTVV